MTTTYSTDTDRGRVGADSVPEPTDADFKLSPSGLGPAARKAALDKLEAYFSAQRRNFLGYQTNEGFEYRTEVARFLDYHSNNVGDPFEKSHFTLHTRAVEQAVLDYYAALWHATPRTSRDNTGRMSGDAYWGYVLTMGSSEGNNYAMWNARDYLSGKTLMREPGDGGGQARQMWVQDTPPGDNLNAFSPVCFYSQDTHYSVAKAMRVLNIPSFFEVGTRQYPHANPLDPGKPWSHEVPSKDGDKGPGSIDVDKLVQLVEFFASMGHPILINLNYGSTFKCAYDDVEQVCERLRPIFTRYGLDRRKVRYGRDHEGNELCDYRTGYWIHIDGALAATYAPYLRKAIEKKAVPSTARSEGTLPRFDFEIPEVCSIVTSGHKYPGSPWPCGIFMTKSKLQMLPPEQPAVIGSPDTTFGGSRNAFSPLIMWEFLARHSEQAQIDMVVKATELAAHAERKLRELGPQWAVARSPWALAVRFRMPENEEIVHRYSLATVPLRTDEGDVQYVHLYVMPHVTKEVIDQLAADLRATEPAAKRTQHPVDGVNPWSYADGVAHVDDVLRLALVRTWGSGF